MEQVLAPPPMELGDYFDIVWRRKWHILIPLALVSCVASVVAVVLPPVYVSEADILIEQAEIPTDYVETTVTGYVQERVQTISKRIMTRARLLEIADKFDLYDDRRGSLTPGELTREMRDSIGIAFESVESGRGSQSIALAFSVSFAYSDPEVARQVANELADLYLDEDRRGRAEQAAQVIDFLDKEAQRLLAQLTELDGKIAEFKLNNMSDLPELSGMNMRLLEQASSQIERSESRLRELAQRRESIQAQLSITPARLTSTSGGGVLTPSDHLAALRSQYLQKSTTYSSDHPDLIKLRRQIAVLEQQTAGSNSASGLSPELDQLRGQLAAALSRYSEDHPDVRKLRRSISSLETSIRASRGLAGQSTTTSAANPKYVMLQTELNAVEEDIQAEKESQEELLEKQAEYERRLVRAPMVQRDEIALTRDYDNAVKKYREIKDKQLEAKLAEQLELDEKGERFTLLGRASAPDTPESPNRLGIVLLGVVLGMGGGLGTAALAEYSDRSVRGSRGIVRLLHSPPLASIPIVMLTEEIRARSRRRWLSVLFCVALVIVGLFVVHYIVMPMGDVWVLVSEQIGTYIP